MNKDHLLILKQGVEIWNQWREKNPYVKPDLSFAILSNYNLKKANLSNSDLRGVNFIKSILYETDFSESDMSACNLSEVNITLANLRGSTLWGANFYRANVSDVHWDQKTKFKGIDVSSCYSNEKFKEIAQNRSFLEEYKIKNPKKYWLWKLSCNCGDSLYLWMMWSLIAALFFAFLYWLMGAGHFDTGKHLKPSFLSMAYYSIVTFTTLGFGDITPKTSLAAIVVTIEVILGYIMLGGLIAIFSSKFVKRH
jgi:hypothetical protein